MPQIPGYQDQLGNRVPSPARGDGAVGGTTAGFDALARLGSIGADIASQVAANERAMKTAQLSTRAAMELEEYVFNVKNNDRDYSTQYQRYEEFTKDLTKRYQEEFAGDRAGYSTFQQNIGQMAFKKGFDVRSHSISGQLDQQKGALTVNMALLSELAVQGDEEQREMVKTKAQLLLNDSVQHGVITAQEMANLGLKFQDDMVGAQVRYDIVQNPDAAAEKLLKGEYAGLSGERQMMWLEKANQKSEANMRRAHAEEDRARREQERAERAAADNMAKAGDKLLFSGQMSADWLEENRDTLDEADYRYYYKALTTGSEGFTDTGIYADLRTRASDGEDVREQARSFLRSGQLKLADYEKLVNRSERNSGTGDVPNWFKRGDQFIRNMLKVSDINPDPAQAQRQARALDEWQQWADANPSPGIDEARKAYQSLAESYYFTEANDSILTYRIPKYMVGPSRSSFDVDATEAATVEAFQAGEITEEEFKKEAALLERYQEEINRVQRVKSKGKADAE